LTAIEESVTERVSRRELRSLRRSATESRLGTQRDQITDALLDVEDLSELKDPVPATFGRRESLVADLTNRLALQGLLALNGSTGMGKSTLARLLALKIGGGSWKRLDLRGKRAREIRHRLARATGHLRAGKPLAGLVVDDLNLDDDPKSYENELLECLRTARAFHCNVIVTTHSRLPSRVEDELGLSGANVVVTPLSELEVRDILILLGCKEGAALATLTRFVHVSTRGHPQLAHARATRLQGQGWPTNPEMLFGRMRDSADLERVQQEVRKRLVDDLPSDDARDLAYRLSVFSGRFSRSQALAIASEPVAGTAFDALCGPWVEGPTGGSYLLSPLLKDSAKQVMTDEELDSVRRRICDFTLKQAPSLSPHEFWELVFQGFLARYERALVAAAMAAARLPEEAEKAVLEPLSWLALASTRPGETLFPESRLTSLMLRDLQFRIAAVTDSELATQVSAAWDAESRGAENNSKESVVSRSQFLTRVIWTIGVSVPIDSVVQYVGELLLLHDAHPYLLPPEAREEHGAADIHSAVLDAALLRMRGPARIVEFLKALEATPDLARERIASEFRRDASHAINLMMSLYETPPPTLPSEELLLAATELATQVGTRLAVPALATAAYRTMAIVDHEYRNDPTAAFARLDAGVAYLAQEPPELAEYRATLLNAIGRPEEAVAIWKAIVPRWKGNDSLRVHSLREAGIAASRAMDHVSAAEFFGDAFLLAKQLELGALGIALQGERGLALWRAGLVSEALDSISLAVSSLSELPDPTSDLQARTLHKMFGHSVLWMLTQTRSTDFFGQPGILEPEAGRLSDGKLDPRFKELPLGPIGDTQALLVALATALDVDVLAARLSDQWLKKKRPTFAAFSLALIRTQQAIRRPLDFQVVAQAKQMHATFIEASKAAEASGRHMRGPQPEDTTSNRGQFVSGVLASCLVHLPQGVDKNEVFRQWAEGLRKGDLQQSPAGEWLELISGLMSERSRALNIARDEKQSVPARLAASTIALSEDLNPDEMFVVTTTLVDGYSSSQWRQSVELGLANLVSAAWLKLIEERRFAFKSPGAVVPAIEAICMDQGVQGMRKCATLLLKAHLGTSVRVPPSVTAMLLRVSDG
jgi:hypothetical protein